MIRIANKVGSACPNLVKDLLQHAFDQAGGVEPATAYKLSMGIGLSTDSRFSFMDKTYALAMDRLSLRSRAVLSMVGVDVNKAIQLFQQIGPPRPPAATCASGFAPDVSIYYQVLAKVLELLRARKPQNDAEAQLPYSLLEQTVAATTSPMQLLPLAKVMDGARMDNAELSMLLNLVATQIISFPVDDRSLNAENDWDGIVELSNLGWWHNISRFGLMQAYRDYLDRSVYGPHCADNLRDPGTLAQTCKSLNKDLATLAADVAPISVPESAPAIEDTPDTGQYWQSLKGKQLLLDAKHVNFDDNWRRYTDADRKPPEWQDRVRHLLDDMDDWDASDEPSPADYYHERSILIYRVLADIPPGSSLYDRVLGEWIRTFTESSLQWDNPPEWYIGVSDFLRFSRKNGPAPAAIDILKNSSNPYLSSLGVLAEFFQ